MRAGAHFWGPKCNMSPPKVLVMCTCCCARVRHDGPMASDWARLGEKLKTSRIARDMEQQQVAAAIGVKRGAVRNIEQGNIAKVTPTVRAYATHVGWADGSVEQVLAGGDPVLA